jgi:pyruvate/2-oxoglutarate dehydrogenase complex dihydrolipoamide acyltransferase (E2) component
MPIQVYMPQFGESVDEAIIVRWLKSAGEPVKEHEPLIEINTDKIDVEVPSPGSGVITEILVPAGQTVSAGTLLAIIDGLSEPDEQPTPPEGEAEIDNQQQSSRRGTHGFISPLVSRLVAEHQIDLTQVTGSGLAGRITKQDILNYLEARDRSTTGDLSSLPEAGGLNRSTQKEIPAGQTGREDADTWLPPGRSRLETTTGDEVMAISPIRRTIAERMVLSKQTSPHVTTVMEADLSRVVSHRSISATPFTFTAYIVQATASALRSFPLVNSSWSEGHDHKTAAQPGMPSPAPRNDQKHPVGIVLHKAVHIGIAVALGDTGLVVPVIRDADMLSLAGIARAIADLSARARSGQLKPEEVKGGTFSITNHGVNGSLFALPIINQPQCGILGVGAIQKRVVVIENPDRTDAIAIRPMIYLTFTFDHRILDGAIADHFLAKIIEGLENWGV